MICADIVVRRPRSMMIRMPGTGAATYHKKEGDWEYFRARILDVSLETVV